MEPADFQDEIAVAEGVIARELEALSMKLGCTIDQVCIRESGGPNCRYIVSIFTSGGD